jgi:hypothetical protein
MSRQFPMTGPTCAALTLLFLSAHETPPVSASAASTLTLSIKGSTAYAKPTPVPIQTALLVVTPVWEDIKAVTEVGGQEASGQPLFLSELAVVFGNRPTDCASVFAATPPSTEQDFLVVAGKAEAYLPAKGWQSTSVGKVLTSAAADATKATRLALDRFSVDAQSPALKKKMVSKDGVRGNDGHLVLEQNAGGWTVDFAAHVDDVVAEGQVMLTACPIAARKKAAGGPLLGERRLLEIARNF